MITVTGNTCLVKDELKKLGAKWDGTNKRWILPDTTEEAVKRLRVPVGGREQLWEPCRRCGEEPVDGSGLCSQCRGTESLTVKRLLTDDEQAKEYIRNISDLTLTLYNAASRGTEQTAPADCREIGSGSPFGGGYHVKLLTDGQALYTYYVHHYDGDRDRCYAIDPTKFKPAYKRAVELLLTSGGES